MSDLIPPKHHSGEAEGSTVGPGFLHDMAERKTMEALLERRERELRDLAENSPDPIVRYDREARRLFANAALASIMGIPSADLIGRSPDQDSVLGAEQAERLKVAIRQVFDGGQSGKTVLEFHGSDGRRRCLEMILVPERDAHGTVESVLGLTREITDLMDAERALRNEQALLRTFIQSMPDPVWMKSPDGVFLACNRAFARLYGVPESEILGRTDYDFVTADQAAFFQQKDREAMGVGGPRMNEEWVTFADDGHRELWETVKTPVYDASGAVTGILGIARDITERKRLEEELRAREQYQRALLDNFPFMVWLKDTESRLLAVNQAYAVMAGQPSPESMLGKTDLDFFPAEQAEQYRADDREVMESGRKKSVEELITDAAGGRWHETYKAPVIVEGRLLGTVGFARDITDRRRASEALQARERESRALGEALREREARYREIFENAADGILLVELPPDGRFRLLEANDALIRMLGCKTGTPGDVAGRTIEDAFRPDGKMADFVRGMVELLDRCIAGGTVLHEEMVQDLPSGRRYFSWSFLPLRDGSGRIHRVVCIARDMTDRIRLDALTRQKQRAEILGHLASRIGHDFRNILGVVMLNAGFLRLKTHDESLLKSIRQIEDSAARADGVIRQMLSFGKSGQKSFVVVSLPALVREDLRFVEIAEGSGIRLEHDLPEDGFPVRADPLQLRQVVVNVCSNAVQAMHDTGGVLDLHVSNVRVSEDDAKSESSIVAPGEYVSLSIRDSGPGIPADIQPHVFDPFFSTREEASGLGLTVAQSIVQAHGGTMVLQSDPGAGCTFEILLPAVHVNRP